MGLEITASAARKVLDGRQGGAPLFREGFGKPDKAVPVSQCYSGRAAAIAAMKTAEATR